MDRESRLGRAAVRYAEARVALAASGKSCASCGHSESRHFAEVTPPFEQGCRTKGCECHGMRRAGAAWPHTTALVGQRP